MEKLTLLFIQFGQKIDSRGVNLPNMNLDEAGFQSRVQGILQVVFGTLGAICVLIIVIAAFQYVTSQGDSQRVGKAKDAILYAVIGLVVSLLAFSVVTFIVGRI